MNNTVTILYFGVMMALVAFLIADFGYDFQDALFLSASYLPTIVLGCLLLRGFKFDGKSQTIVRLICFVVALYFLQLLLTVLANVVLMGLSYSGDKIPVVLENPVLVFVILLLYYLPYRLLVVRFMRSNSQEENKLRKVEFISNRKKVSLMVSEIRYVESRDSEVWLHVASGDYYKSRTNISSWAVELGGGFVRIHRSFLVNTAYVEGVVGNVVTLQGGITLDISRSYRQKVENLDDMLLPPRN